jgi:hypothetical protein
VLQGWIVTDPTVLTQLDLAGNETVVEVPKKLMTFLPEGVTVPASSPLVLDRGETYVFQGASEPVTEYIRFEYDISFTNIVAGEQGRWLPRRRTSGIALPGNDFWLLDGARVQFNHFTGDGDWAGVEWCEDPDVVKLCATAFDAVWAAGIDHSDYIPA